MATLDAVGGPGTLIALQAGESLLGAMLLSKDAGDRPEHLMAPAATGSAA